MAKFAFYLLLSLFGLGAYADLDPASPLLRGSGKSPSLESLDSGRFIIKPAARSPRSSKKSSEKVAPTSIAKPDPKTDADKGPVEPDQAPSEAPEPDIVMSEPPTPNAGDTETPATEPSTPQTTSDLTLMEKMRVLVLGTTDKELLAIRQKQEVKNLGQNIVEIELSPTYFYFDSTSKYSVREQSSSSPGFSAGLSLWASPYFAIQAQTQSSLGASISDLSTGAVSGQTLTKNRVGLSFRSIDLDSNDTAQTSWGFSYIEFESAIANDVIGRVKTKSSGFSISFDAKIPVGSNYQHSIGVSIDPKLSHKEQSGVQGIKSGTSNISSSVSARFGGDIRFQRQNQIYWLIEHRYEKNLFKGVASFADPKTGSTPDGVSVDHGLTLFSIGYRWGK